MQLKNTGKTITKAMLKTLSGEFELASILTLHLSNKDISDLGCMGDCSTLEILDLSHNSITTLYSLASLTQLTHLDVSHNNIESLEGLQTLDTLGTLNVAGNLLNSVEVLWNISELNQLWNLTLRTVNASNPFLEKRTVYRQDVINILPGIKILDGECIGGQGGEVFSSCAEMEEETKDLVTYTSRSYREFDSADGWIPEGFWKESGDMAENTGLVDMDTKMTDLLSSCHTLSAKGQDLLTSHAKSSL